jgi:hypothetical protein
VTSNLLIAKPDIPKRAYRVTSKNTYDADLMLRNVKRGLRHNFAKLAAAATQEYVQYDLGVGNTAAADHLIIARADMLQSDGVTKVTLTGSSASITQPLEVTTQPTVFWDFSDDSQVTQTAIRGISALGNKGSVAAATLAQATAGSQFVKTLAGNSENRALKSEDFTSGYWDKNGAATVVTANAAANPVDGAMTADLIADNPANANSRWILAASAYASYIAPGETVTISCWMKSADGGTETFNLAIWDGTTGWQRSASLTMTGEWQLFSLTKTFSTHADRRFGFDNLPADGCYAWGFHCRNSAADSGYLATDGYPYFRGVNGHSVARAMGAQWMDTAAQLGALISAGACEVFAVTRFAATGEYYLIQDTASEGWLQVLYNATGKARIYNYDGNLDNAVTPNAVAVNSVGIVNARHEGGNIIISTNGGAEATAASGNTTPLTRAVRVGRYTTNYVVGDLCAILIWNVALSEADRAAVYAWAASRFSTAPAYQSLTFSTATLYGPHDADFVTTFATTSAYRYWWLEYGFADGGTTTSVFPRSKEYFGTMFDIGAHPNSYDFEREIPQSGKLDFPLGNRFLAQTTDPKFAFNMTWRGVSDANAKTFLQMLDEPQRDLVFLYAPATGNDEILSSQVLIHCKAVSDSCIVRPVYVNYNDVQARFEEVLG